MCEIEVSGHLGIPSEGLGDSNELYLALLLPHAMCTARWLCGLSFSWTWIGGSQRSGTIKQVLLG